MGYCLILNTNWKFNSKQSSTRNLANKILHLFKHLSSVKGVYKQASLIIMYYIVSLGKANDCLIFSEEVAKKVCIVYKSEV